MHACRCRRRCRRRCRMPLHHLGSAPFPDHIFPNLLFPQCSVDLLGTLEPSEFIATVCGAVTECAASKNAEASYLVRLALLGMIPLVARRESVSVEGRVSIIGALWPRAEAALADAVPNIQIYLCRTVVPALFALYAGAGEDGEIGKLIDTLRCATPRCGGVVSGGGGVCGGVCVCVCVFVIRVYLFPCSYVCVCVCVCVVCFQYDNTPPRVHNSCPVLTILSPAAHSSPLSPFPTFSSPPSPPIPFVVSYVFLYVPVCFCRGWMAQLASEQDQDVMYFADAAAKILG